MQFTKFGQTGLTVSRMILGTGTFGKQTDEKEAHRMLDKAAKAGMRCISFTEQLGRTWKCRAVACVYPRLVCGVIRTDL